MVTLSNRLASKSNLLALNLLPFTGNLSGYRHCYLTNDQYYANFLWETFTLNVLAMNNILILARGSASENTL